jgi:hypothetical protein
LRRKGEDDPATEVEGQDEGAAEANERSAAPRRQPPALVQDVYRDLRDRNLLLPAVGLLVALLLVPMALRAEPTPPPPVSAPDTANDASAVTPAVLAEQETGIRDYRKRLAELKEKNPFKAKFQFTPQEVGQQTAISEPPAAPSSGGGDGGGTGSPSPAPGQPTAPAGGGPQPAPSTPKVRGQLIEPIAKVLVGRVGEKKRKREYRVTDPVPGKKRAIATFAGFDDSFESGLFLVSRYVVATRGDGRCRPSGRECDLVVMKPGDARFFDLERPDGSVHRYRLKLLKVRTELVAERILKDR